MANQFHLLNNSNDDQQENHNIQPRSIDDYLDTAYQYQHSCNTSSLNTQNDILKHWRYYIIFLALGIANSGDSAEMGATNYILSSETFQHDILGSDNDTDDVVDFAKKGSAIAGAHFLGMLISGLLSGVLADIVGRRKTLLLGLMGNTIVGVLSSLARNAIELCILRFLCGINLGMVIAGVVTLTAEISPPSKRGRFMTLVASCYTLGFLYTALWALLIFKTSDDGSTGSGSWRLFMFINAIPTMIAATLVVIFAPESPRFYLCRGRLKEAVQVSNLIASRIGYIDKPLTEEELRQYLYQAKGIGETSFRAKETIEVQNMEQTNSIREVWTSLLSIRQVFIRGYWRTTVPLQFTYFCLTLTTGVATWWTKIFQILQLQTDPYALSFYSTLSQIPGMMLASGLIENVGRRRLVISGFSGGFVALLLLSVTANDIQITIDDPNVNYSWIVLAAVCAHTICLCICWLGLDCLSAESFPTRVRSTGRGVCVATGRLAGFCVQFLYGPLVDKNRLSYMMSVASIFAIGGIIVSCKTTDTTNVDLRDHWDGEKEWVGSERRISLPKIRHSSKYASCNEEIT